MASPSLKSENLAPQLICGECGYDLREARDRCPECGRRFDPSHLIDALIPWEQRRQIGWIRTYWRTAWLATFEPWKIGPKIGNPISYRSARLFRWITLVIGVGPLLITAIVGRSTTVQSLPQVEWSQLLSSPWSLSAGLIGIFLGFAAVSGTADWFFYQRDISRQRRGRALALSCYSTAPIVWLPAFAAVGWAAFPTDAWVGWVLAGLFVCLWLMSTLVMLHAVSGGNWRKVVAAGVLLPPIWIVLLAITATAAELVLAFATLIWLSFQ